MNLMGRWPQAADELLEDMYLNSRRGGGNWITRPFKVIDSSQLKTLAAERRAICAMQVGRGVLLP